jgi:hypothetical protein
MTLMSSMLVAGCMVTYVPFLPAGSRFRPRSTSLANGREDGVKRSAQPRPVETISPIADGGYALRTGVRMESGASFAAAFTSVLLEKRATSSSPSNPRARPTPDSS